MPSPVPPLGGGDPAAAVQPDIPGQPERPAPAHPASARGPLPDAALLSSAWNGADALYLLTAGSVVEAWNPAAEALWGIAAHEAIGRHIDDLLDWEPISGPGRDEGQIPPHATLWFERTLDRPRFGPRQGELIVVDVTISAEREPDGRIVRYVITSRDVTRSVNLAREMAPLSALATTGGAVRDRHSIASQALDILRKGTGADEGVAALIGEGGYDFLAEINPGRFGPVLERIDPNTSPLIRALLEPAHLISGDPSAMPLSEDVRAMAVSLGLRWIVAVGLWNRGSLDGLLALGWIRTLPEEPPDALVGQAAAHLSAALENARLLEEMDARFQAAQTVSARLEALMGMSRLPEAGDIETLGRSVLQQLIANLGAAAGAIWQLNGDRWIQVTEIGLHPAVALVHKTASAFNLAMWGGTGDAYSPYIRPFARGFATAASRKAATEAGYTARAAFPIEEHGRIGKVLVLYFSGPPEGIAIDDRTLEAIGRSVAAAFANQHLRERLVDAVATQRGLAEQYGVMFRDSPNALLRMSAETEIVDINAAALDLLGGALEDWMGRRAAAVAVIDAEERQRLIRPAAGERVSYQVQGRRHDGTTFPMEAVVSSLTIDGAESFLVYIRDLAEERRLQAELGLAQKMDAVGQLVAGVAHELNNPLAAIIGFSQIIERDGRLPEELRHDAGLLVQESARTKRIVQNLLDFARQRPRERHPTRLRPLIESVLELQSYQFAGEWLRADVDIPDTIPAVSLDRSQMQQVILNLTQNAIQAIRSKATPGTLRIVAEHVVSTDSPALVRISIEDDGPGVPEEDRSRLFLPFFTTREPGHGTGLGLSVSFGIVAGHDGRLSFVPRPGGGSIFVIELPVHPVEQAPSGPTATDSSTESPAAEGVLAGPTAEHAPVQPSAHPVTVAAAPEAPTPRVLVLDDEPAIRTYLARVLRSCGLEPTLVATGPEALACIDAQRFDIMICDHRMPGMTGTDVYEEVALRQPDLAAHFVLMSGDALNPRLRAFAETRRLRVLEKPFDIAKITAVVRETLGPTV